MKILAFILFSLILLACGTESTTSKSISEVNQLVSTAENKAAYDLMARSCFACHSPEGDIDNRLGPPMIAVKKHYVDDKSTLESFTAELVAYVNNPTEANAKMPGAIRRFGLMPKMDFKENDLKAIAKYIFENDIKEPKWFKKHHEQERNSTLNKDNLSVKAKGLKLAMVAKKVLGKNLMSAINAHGSAYAVSFCNIKANHLLDSMSNELDAHIKRVTDQPRNPEAMATKAELAAIKQFKSDLKAGEELSGITTDFADKTVGYYPITTNQMCIQCHGQKKADINTETLAKLKVLYPDDKATGYDINELRGIWVVDMVKED